MRIALAQIDPTVGDIDGNAAKIAEWIGRAREEGADLVDLPRALRARLPGRGPLSEAPLHRGEPARGGGARRAAPARSSALVGFAEPVAGRRATAAAPTTRSPSSPTARSRRSTARTGCPTTPSSTSSATSSPASEPATLDRRSRRRRGRADGLRGRLGAGRPGAGGGRRRRGADRQPLGLAVPPRQGPRAGGDVRRAGARIRRPLRLLQPGRRPGRARLRRPQLPARPRRRAAGAGRPVRGGAARLRRPRRRRLPRPSRSPTSTRSTPRWRWVCATTSRRTAFATSGWRSRAGSTPRWWRCSPSTRWAPDASPASSCPLLIPAMKPRATPERSLRTSAASCSRSRSSR